MGKITPKSRSSKIKIDQKRRLKLKKLRESYKNTSKKKEKEEVKEKIVAIAPYLKTEEYLK